jgi:diaminopimelate decarboxylase
MPASPSPSPIADYPQFHYLDGRLYCEQVDVAELCEQHQTPLYIYSKAAMVERFAALRQAFGERAHICYALKSNGNLSLLRLFHELGAGFDVVSGGELMRLQAAGIPTDKVVFAGVGKEEWEIRAALRSGILFFNLESRQEVRLLQSVGRDLGQQVPVAVRLNPDVDAGTHDYIATARKQDKFGLDLRSAAEVVTQIAGDDHLSLVGYHVHLGSNLRSSDPYLAAFECVETFLSGASERQAGVRFYDLGGGFGISYGDGGGAMDVQDLGNRLAPRLQSLGLTPVLEPGRYLTADAGILATRVLGSKSSGNHRFLVVDGAMNDLIRPALYGAEHPIAPVMQSSARTRPRDVVGPVCESGDFLARQRELPEMRRGDLLAVFAAGAYGFSMASNYNTRRRPAEVLVDGSDARLIRRRESFPDLWAHEEGA